jgi:hypothetical protein
MCERSSFKRPKMAKRTAVYFARDEALAKLLPTCHERLKAALLHLHRGSRE